MDVERRLRRLNEPPQPRPAGHQSECTGSRPEPLDGYRPERLHVPLPAIHAALLHQFPNFSIINQINSAASSSYNALQVTLKTNHGTDSPANLPTPGATTWTTPASLTPSRRTRLNLTGVWGNANNDIRNHFSAYLSYEIPAFGRGPKL